LSYEPKIFLSRQLESNQHPLFTRQLFFRWTMPTFWCAMSDDRCTTDLVYAFGIFVHRSFDIVHFSGCLERIWTFNLRRIRAMPYSLATRLFEIWSMKYEVWSMKYEIWSIRCWPRFLSYIIHHTSYIICCGYWNRTSVVKIMRLVRCHYANPQSIFWIKNEKWRIKKPSEGCEF
jgi:hypothetical protein